jgi:hypothetical protein
MTSKIKKHLLTEGTKISGYKILEGTCGYCYFSRFRQVKNGEMELFCVNMANIKAAGLDPDKDVMILGTPPAEMQVDKFGYCPRFQYVGPISDKMGYKPKYDRGR